MKVFLIAGEPSGDLLGAAVMEGLSELRPDVRFVGVGGAEMERRGLSSLFPMSDLSVMGLAEVLPRLPHLLARARQTVAAVEAARPDVLLTIDSPDFSLRVARRVRRRVAVPTVHYVAPTVWAWRPGRAARMARYIDHVLALLPFEPPYMTAAGMGCDFVGHPAAHAPVASAAEARAFRARHGIGKGPLVLALPGSRRGEVTRLSARFGEALGLLAQERPDIRVVLPAGGHVAGLVRELVADWPVTPMVIDPAQDPEGADKRAAFAAADVALAASGTVSLELAATATPMVIGYDLSPLTRFIARRMVRLESATLVNLVSETRAVPEYLGEACTASNLAAELGQVLDNPSAQLAAMKVAMERLGRGGEAPGLRAARAVLGVVEGRMP